MRISMQDVAHCNNCICFVCSEIKIGSPDIDV
jgi:hypothetical protein